MVNKIFYMMHSYRAILILLIPAFLSIKSCSDQKENTENKNTDQDEITITDYKTAKEELKADLQALKNRADQQINKLKRKLESVSGESRTEINSSIEELKIEKERLNNKISEVEKTSRETWDEVKREAEKIKTDAEAEIDRVRENVRKFFDNEEQ